MLETKIVVSVTFKFSVADVVSYEFCLFSFIWQGDVSLSDCYPTAFKGCLGIVFTHGVWMSGRGAGKVCPGCISQP